MNKQEKKRRFIARAKYKKEIDEVMNSDLSDEEKSDKISAIAHRADFDIDLCEKDKRMYHNSSDHLFVFPQSNNYEE